MSYTSRNPSADQQDADRYTEQLRTELGALNAALKESGRDQVAVPDTARDEVLASIDALEAAVARGRVQLRLTPPPAPAPKATGTSFKFNPYSAANVAVTHAQAERAEIGRAHV